MKRVIITGGVAALGLAASVAPVPASASAQASVTVVASKLDGPRGLAFGPDGALYVAESGSGGKIKCATVPAEPGGEASKVCLGLTGKISKLADGELSTVVKDLPSAGSDGLGTGPHDVAFAEDGSMLVPIGLGGDGKLRAGLGPKGKTLGTLLKIKDGKSSVMADLLAFEVKHNPDKKDKGSAIDSYPFAVVPTPQGGALVTDVGANDVLQVSASGKVTLRAVFHARKVAAPAMMKLPKGSKVPMQSVPMGIAAAPDGSYYVAEHAGFPQPEGVARVFRLAGKKVETAVKGFTTVVDVAFDGSGRLVVLGSVGPVPSDHQPRTSLYRIEADGKRTELLKPGTLSVPLGLAVAGDGAVYVSNKGFTPGKGEIVRVDLPA
ncbi:MAG: ScyD/ScyE family protein [Nonomuraea sp.]|nr:ScyD/ScyE family protein [Streptomyces sp.]NUP66645.1 ScyD/ScyE family protein [Nonomuraea sp.]NUP79032.1 ScyD/ScyE family protein [Nonomuraea sp.]NUS06654.1 ScyD/ScyE family protein [Nonomuraea sp.]NUT44443.1 ScyD/ScyE family protein [Thermoactinospora sp.]